MGLASSLTQCEASAPTVEHLHVNCERNKFHHEPAHDIRGFSPRSRVQFMSCWCVRNLTGNVFRLDSGVNCSFKSLAELVKKKIGCWSSCFGISSNITDEINLTGISFSLHAASMACSDVVSTACLLVAWLPSPLCSQSPRRLSCERPCWRRPPGTQRRRTVCRLWDGENRLTGS